MCGISGALYTTKIDNRIRPFLKLALYAGAVRGEDGTGVITVNRFHGDAEINKLPVTSAAFIASDEGAEAIGRVMTSSCVIAHNRASTVGKDLHVNTHPFVYDHISMVHNGTIKNKYAFDIDADVDSAAICKGLATLGEQETIEKIEGAFTLVWHNATDNTLNMVRNDERPLHIAELKDNDGILFASEVGMLTWLADRPHVYLNIEETYSLKVGEWRKYELNKGKDFGNYESVECKVWKAPVYDNYHKPSNNIAHFPANTQNAIDHYDQREAKLKQYGMSFGSSIKLKAAFFTPYQFSKGDNKAGYWTFDARGKARSKITFTYHNIRSVAFKAGQRYELSVKDCFLDIQGTIKTIGVEVVQFSDPLEDTSEDVYLGPLGLDYTKEDMLGLLHSGCASCGNPLFLKDVESNDVKWDLDANVYCGCCPTQDEMAEQFNMGIHQINQ